MGDQPDARAARSGAEMMSRVRSRFSRLARVSTLADESVVLVLCVGAVIGIGLMASEFPEMPFGGIVVPVLVGGLFLRTRSLAVVDLAVVGMIIRRLVVDGFGAGGIRTGTIVVIVITLAFAHLLAASRERLGLQGLRGEAMLVELRDRLVTHGEMPPLPGNWHAEVVLRSAGGAAFGGDFVVSALSEDGKRLEVAVVDVSGKGVEAATRALQLSGALGGVLGSLPPDRFLVAANNYLLRQDWMDDFATAVHVSIDLTTGEYAVSSAGHPPVVQFDAGSGRWRTVDVDGAMLGLLPSITYATKDGTLRNGDALLLYTDGLIEVSGRDLEIGVDKLLGEAERLVTVGFADSARGLIDAVAPGGADDRALVMLWRA